MEQMKIEKDEDNKYTLTDDMLRTNKIINFMIHVAAVKRLI